MKKLISFSACSFLLFFHQVFAQPSVQKLKLQLQQNRTLVADFSISNVMPAQASVLMEKNANIPMTGIKDWLGNNLQLRLNTDLLVQKNKPVNFGSFEVQKLQQYYKGIKVEHGIINITGKSGKTAMLQMEFYPIGDDFKITPTITEEAARSAAIRYTGAKKYAWQEKGRSKEIPRGEIVIIADFNNNGAMTLAWKFDIYAIQPLSRAYVYVKATDGSVLLSDNIVLYENGKADTRFSGQQTIVTDKQTGPLLKPYRLRQMRNGYEIRTLNYGYLDQSITNDALATDFTDDDNNWTKQEFGDSAVVPNKDDAALEAHFNMQIVSDYWVNVHGRNSWDNNFSNIISYIHVNQNGALMDNAYWDGHAMYFGDGDGAGDPPQVSIDDCGHELGHAICQTTSALVYRWESGAINEGFSDIWAACITNYALGKFNPLPGFKTPWLLFEETTGPSNIQPGLRDMSNPALFNDPSTYKGPNWRPATFDVCKVPSTGRNDNCGVHHNSGVMNKWFFLITAGENGMNSLGQPYSVTGINFGKSDSIAYLTELNLTPNAGFKTVRNVSVNAAITLYGDNAEAKTVRDAWLAVGVDTAVFNMSNTAVFTINSFSSIAIGKAGCIWAGTTTSGSSDNASKGVYRFDGKKWDKAPVLLNNAAQQIMADKNGGIWIAQSGRTGAQALTGGVNYFPDSAFSSNVFYSTSEGLVSRNARSIFVDTSRLTSGNPAVWVATLAQITAGESEKGGIGTGLNTYIPIIQNYFSKQSHGIDPANGTGGAQTIGGNETEVWAFASANFGQNQLIRYNSATRDSIGAYDYRNVPLLTPNFQAKSIYFDFNKNKWLGLQQNGLLVLDKNGVWHKIDTAAFRTILPYGTIVNNNAIAGDKQGNVYIGTNNGLVYYNQGPLDQVSSYRRFTTVHGLPSNNVRGIAIDTIRYKLLLATDNGILFFDQQCNGKGGCYAQIPNRKSESASLSNGNWSDPSIWSTNKVPDENTNVKIANAVAVDIEASCSSITLSPPGSLNVNAGKKLTIVQVNNTTILTSSSKKY